MSIEIPLPWPVEINLSKPALGLILAALDEAGYMHPDPSVVGEVDNFRNLLQNLLERSEPETDNFDLIGG